MKKTKKCYLIAVSVVAVIVASVILLRQDPMHRYYRVSGTGVPEEQTFLLENQGRVFEPTGSYKKVLYSKEALPREEREFFEVSFWLQTGEEPAQEDLWLECRIGEEWYRTRIPYDFEFDQNWWDESETQAKVYVRSLLLGDVLREGEYRLVYRVAEEQYCVSPFRLEVGDEANGEEPENFIQDYVALRPGISEEQVAESEDCVMEILQVAFVSPVLDPDRSVNLHDRYEISYALTNQGEQDLRVDVDDILEYKVNGEWYQEEVESGATFPMGKPVETLGAGQTDYGIVAIGRVLDPENSSKPTDCFWRGEYRILRQVITKGYVPLYFEIE